MCTFLDSAEEVQLIHCCSQPVGETYGLDLEGRFLEGKLDGNHRNRIEAAQA